MTLHELNGTLPFAAENGTVPFSAILRYGLSRCGVRVARQQHPVRRIGERSEAPTAAGAAAELNFEMLIVVNNKFVDELAFVVFVFKNLGGTV